MSLSKCTSCGGEVYGIGPTGNFWLHTVNGTIQCPAPAASAEGQREDYRIGNLKVALRQKCIWDEAKQDWVAPNEKTQANLFDYMMRLVPIAAEAAAAPADQREVDAQRMAAQVVGQFAHWHEGREWVTNPNPDRLRSCIAQAAASLASRARLEGLEEAAKECEAISKANYTGAVDTHDDYARRCLEVAAKTIRALRAQALGGKNS
jgi:hypothetical protein